MAVHTYENSDVYSCAALSRGVVFTGVLVLALLAFPSIAGAHCDTMDGPVVAAARLALEKSDITPVLKWFEERSEPEARRAFDLTRLVRTNGGPARELADLYFFETIVRLHRLGEGEPYTGLKPADYPVDPMVVAADRALNTGLVDPLLERVTTEVEQVLRARFAQAAAARIRADHSVAEGRAFVRAYGDFVGLIEHLSASASDAPDEQVERGPAVDRR